MVKDVLNSPCSKGFDVSGWPRQVPGLELWVAPHKRSLCGRVFLASKLALCASSHTSFACVGHPDVGIVETELTWATREPCAVGLKPDSLILADLPRHSRAGLSWSVPLRGSGLENRCEPPE